ncbi:cell wall hydrolase [Novosphingobium sp.]|uniref:cell wall hydrolase n=1 Tax=Novosphingobium sp. TaxID=1874826 RepID=UPI0031DCCB29
MIAPVHIARLWDAGLVAVLALACALVSYVNWGMADSFTGLVPGRVAAAPVVAAGTGSDPELESLLPQQIRNLSSDAARAYNIASPLEPTNPAAPPFHPEWLSAQELERATDCMATAIYYEAASESLAGQLAVAQVILNRVRHPHFPKTVCAVVNQGSERALGCQFTFTCDGALTRAPNPAGLQRARRVAQAALHGATSAQAGQATHYHTIWIVPRWAGQLRKVAIIEHHVFYRPSAFYAGYTLPTPLPALEAHAETPDLAMPRQTHPAIAVNDRPDSAPPPMTSEPKKLMEVTTATFIVPEVEARPLPASDHKPPSDRKIFQFGRNMQRRTNMPLTRF